MVSNMSTEYGADQIQILEGLEAVRKRPGMYIGSTSLRGLHHLVYEIVDNAILMASSAEDIDFMIHGIFSYEIFGHTVWITTTHVCLLIVMLVIMGFCIAAGMCMKKASEVPGVFQNIVELVVELLDAERYVIVKMEKYN